MVERRRAWRAVDADLFRFTTTDLRDLHVALMTAFEDAAVLAPALNLEQVRAALAGAGWEEPTPDEVLQRALQALVDWRLLESTQDHGAHYATPEEFERKNLQWSLTGRGEAAIGGLLHALDALRHAVGLQPAVLDAIGDGLADLAELLATPGADNARIHIRLAEVEGHLNSLVTSVRQFNGHLQQLVRDDATGDDVFVDVKRRTVAYLEEYVDGVERPQRRVAQAIERLRTGAGAATLFDRALAGANLAPVAGDDPAPAWLAERARRWAAMQAWFAPTDGSPPRIAGLLHIARTAIVALLRVLERRWDSRRRATSVAEDYKRLAELFAAAPGEEEAHRLFGAAFGLWPARHAHLSPADGEARSQTTPWAVAGGVEVAPALRTTGTLVNAGRLRPVADPARWRAQRQREQAERLAADDGVRAALATAGAVRLSAFGRLPVEAFAELLALLSAGLDAPVGADGARRALSVDGRVEVVLRDPGDHRQAVLHTAGGTLRGPDLLVSITLAGEAARLEATGG
ncbi:MAG: TIGR02677 family protein [Acidimicrobiales bacterium]